MSEVIKRYTFFAYLDDDVAELDCHEEEDGDYVLASDYDRDTKALEDKARSQHARDSVELRDLCSQRDGFKAELWRVKEERDSQQRIAITAMAELAELKAVMAESLDNYRAMLHASEAQVEELKAKMEGAVLVPVELIEHVKHARKLLGGNGAPEWQREKLRQKLTDLLANALLAAPQRPAIVAALQAECKGLEDEVNKLERNLAAAPSREGEV